MFELKVQPLVAIQDILVQMSMLLSTAPQQFMSGIPEEMRTGMADSLNAFLTGVQGDEFAGCRVAAERFIGTLRQTSDPRALTIDVECLRRSVNDVGGLLYCMALSKREKELYAPSAPLFGPRVESAFPSMSEDISEAGKCIALERSTAAVFHLMRVVEIGLQKFGDKLGVILTSEKNWQNILDEVNKALKAMDHKLPRTKMLAEASAHLYAVKVAWRNEVMHPKQTYTQREAEGIFGNVRTFISDLAEVL